MKLSETQRLVLIIVLTFALVGAFFYWLFLSAVPENPPLSRPSVLELPIAGEIPERVPRDPFAELLGEKKIAFQDLLLSIRKASIDPNVKAILLRPQFPLLGLGKQQELRNALLRFKEKGKPIYAYLDNAGKWDYYLASVADTIVGVQAGFLLVNGLLSQAIFLKGTLNALGIEADFIAHGRYKTAPEIFTRESMSDAHREMINSILDDVFPHFVSTIAQGRNLPPERVRQLIDVGFFSMEKAYEEGLVDTLLDYHQLREHFKEQLGRKNALVSFWRYRDIPMAKLGVKAEQKLAVVFGVGSIVVGGEEAFGQDGLITSEGMAAAIDRAAENKDIKAIILRIDSPGGSGTASDIIWQAVRRAREKKPVVVSVGDVAASGGYYISMAADTIVAPPGSIVGSIGVFAGKFAMGGLYRKIRMNKEELERGRNADLFSDLKKFDPAQRRLLTDFILQFYHQFVQKVATSRKMAYEQVDRIARGRVWTGRQGADIGLIDILGDFYDAVQVAKKMAGIPEEEAVQLVWYPRQKTLAEMLLQIGTDSESRLLNRLLSRQFSESFRSVLFAVTHFRDGEPLFLMPYLFTVP